MLKQLWVDLDVVGLCEFIHSAVSSADRCAGYGTTWGVQWDRDVQWGCMLWAGSMQQCCMPQCVAHVEAYCITLGGDWKSSLFVHDGT